MSESFPTWIEQEDESVFLREVCPRVYVGARKSIGYRHWGLVIDLHGSPGHDSDKVVFWIFNDGEAFPDGSLSNILHHVLECLNEESGDVLIACEMGRSRSASCAYAMIRKIFKVSSEEAYSLIKTSTSFKAGTNLLTVDWPRTKTLNSAIEWVES